MSTSRKPVDDGDRGSNAALTTLAREVAELRAAVTEQGKQTTASGEAAAAALRAAKSLTDTVEQLRATYSGGGSPAGGPPPPPGDSTRPPAGTGEPAAPWWTVNDPDEARARLADLADWIATVYIRYADARADPVHELRPCWPYHPDVVTELLTLRDTWHAVYYGPNASPQAVSDWHDRYRPGTVARVGKAMKSCSLHKHGPNDYTPPRTPGQHLVDDLADWWGTTQGASAPPPPSQDAFAAEQSARALSDQTNY